MANIQTIKTKIQGLIDKGNEATGNSATDLTTVVTALISGFGQGGSEISIKSGSFQQMSAPYTVNHGLGVLPDIIIAKVSGYSSQSGNRIFFCLAFSEKFYKKLNNLDWKRQFLITNPNNSSTLQWSYTNCDFAIEDPTGPIHDANETSVQFGNTTYPLTTLKGYPLRWIAIGGLA